MKRLLALLIALGGIGFLFTRFRNRRGIEEPVSSADPRAEELRRKLAETRTTPAPSSPDEGRAVEASPLPDAAEVAAARRRVYEQGRMAVDEMQRAGIEPPA